MSGIKVAALYAALGLDKSQYDKGLSDAESRSRGWGSKIGSIFKSAGKAIAIGIGVGIAALGALGVAAAGNAVEQERATARVKATYGEAGEAVTKWAQDNSRALGINDDVLELSMAQYGDWAKNVGMSTEEAMASGKDMVRRAQEISLATGRSFEEVFKGLFKGQQGMSRGLKEYGITVDKAMLEQEALRQGWIKEGDTLDAATAARARGNLIMQQSTQFTKIAADMQDGLVQKQRQAAVVVDEAMDTIGVMFLNIAQVVLPIVVDALMAVSDWVGENMPTIQAVFDTVLGAITAAFSFLAEEIIPRVMEVFGALFGGAGEDAVNFGAIFADVFAAVSGIVTFFVDEVLPVLTDVFKMVVTWFAKNWPTISSVFSQVFGAISNVIRTVWPVIAAIAKVLFPLILAAAGVLLKGLDKTFKLIGGIFEVGGEIAETVVNAIKTAWRGLTGFFEGLWRGISGAIKGGINFVIGLINGMIDLINGIQIHIPGFETPFGTVAKFDWNGLNLGRIPYLAQGVRDFAGGMAVVGEHGPELVKLPRGSDVYSHGATMGMLNETARVEVTVRDPDGAIRSGGYSQADVERFLGDALTQLVSGARHRSLRMGVS